MKILCVDDSQTIHRIVQNALSVLNLPMVSADNGQTALNILQSEGDDISLILLDWNMPIMSGIEFLREIKKSPKWNHIPVMMLTSEGSQQSMVEAIRTGAINYITKPFAQEDLLTKIMQCLGQGI